VRGEHPVLEESFCFNLLPFFPFDSWEARIFFKKAERPWFFFFPPSASAHAGLSFSVPFCRCLTAFLEFPLSSQDFDVLRLFEDNAEVDGDGFFFLFSDPEAGASFLLESFGRKNSSLSFPLLFFFFLFLPAKNFLFCPLTARASLFPPAKEPSAFLSFVVGGFQVQRATFPFFRDRLLVDQIPLSPQRQHRPMILSFAESSAFFLLFRRCWQR